MSNQQISNSFSQNLKSNNHLQHDNATYQLQQKMLIKQSAQSPKQITKKVHHRDNLQSNEKETVLLIQQNQTKAFNGRPFEVWNNLNKTNENMIIDGESSSTNNFFQQNYENNAEQLQEEVKSTEIKLLQLDNQREIKNKKEKMLNIEQLTKAMVFQKTNKKIHEKTQTENPEMKKFISERFKNEQIQKGNASNKIHSVEKFEFQKYNLKKQKQAENKMMENVQFVKQLKGLNREHSHKEWKQSKSSGKNLLAELKESKKKYIEGLGFPSISAQCLTPQIPSITSIKNNFNSVNQFPQIKSSKNKCLIFKPAAFSLYTIQKHHQMFYYKLAF